ncbi:MAG: hypothetical protein FD174_1113 [Geobacteraceae bacterium]|nr:MAG: hypothetical protein FD174_1113 [Geobacteraceae bacterium]
MHILVSLLKRSSIKPVIPAAILCLILQGTTFAAPVPLATPLSPVTEGVSSPVRVAVDPSGNLYLTDPRGGGVLRYSSAGKLLQVISTNKPPQGIAVTAGGNLVVSQGDYAAIVSRTGAEIGRLGIGAGQFKMANGVAIDAAGRIYVVDSLDNCVQVFNANGTPFSMASAAPGKPANSFGSFGNLPGQFSSPAGIAYEKSSDQLAVADTLNGRVQFFTLLGVHQKTVGSPGSGPLKFTSPQGVVFEYTKDPVPVVKRIYVVDGFQSNLQAIDPAGSGTFLGFIGSYGTANGQLMAPSDGAFDAVNGRLIVVNGYGNLTVYGISDAAGPIPGVTPPALAINPLPVQTGVSTLTISGTVSVGANVAVATDTAASDGAATVTGTTWSYAITGLVPGVNGITVTATDASGNVATKTASIALSETAPSLAINPVTALTNLDSQTITGVIDAGVNVTVRTNTSATAGAVTYPTTTSWKCAITGLVPGENTITATAAKTGGGSASASAVITLDSTAPALAVSALANGSTTSLQTQNIMGSATDANFDKVTVNGQPVLVVNGAFSMPLILKSGDNGITVVASDLAGNATTDKRTVTFDAARPQSAIATPADGAVTNAGTLTVNGTVAANSTVTVGGAPAQMSGGNWTASVNLSPGINTFEVKVVDLSGANSTVKRTVMYNPAGPEVAVTLPGQDFTTNQAKLGVAGTASAGVTVTATVNGASKPVLFSNGSYSFTADLPGEGVYRVAVTALDNAGQAATTIRNVVYDTTPPQLTLNPVTASMPTNISGTIDPDAVLTATDKSGAVGAVTVGGGTWSVDLTGVSYDPATLVITATDAAGNRSAKTPTATSVAYGDLDGNDRVEIADALRALQIAAGIVEPTGNDLLHGDLAPFVDGKPAPNGVIDVGDALVILRKIVGLASW